ncbi:MAG TPA: DUF1003 domain-containing protein [Vicinamibacterales bacterium]|jgi:uncharacterized membrane protein
MTPADPLVHNVHAIVELERQAIHERSALDRIADNITAFAGSRAFIVGHVVWFVAWILINRTDAAFDPYPFSLLNVLVSLEAVFLATFVLMTQNRMTKQADRRAHLDLQVNLLAEQELTAILQMLYALCQKGGVCARISNARVQQLLQETDIVQLARTLDQELKE